MAVSSKGYFAISVESTPGTAITTPTNYYPVEEVNFDWENEFIDIREIRGSRQSYQSLDGRIAPTASVRGAFYPSGAMGLFMYGLFGAKSAALESTSVTAYRHDFTDGATLPYFTLERADARSGEGGLICERLAGAKVSDMSFTATFGEKVDYEVMFEVMNTPTTETPVAAGSISYPVEKPLIFSGATVEVDDTTNSYFKTLNFDVTNTLARQEALNGSQNAYKIFEGSVECTISGTMVFEDLSFYNYLLNGTEIKLEAIFTSQTVADATPDPDVYYGAHFTWDIVRVARYSLPFTAGDVIEAEVDFKVIYDDANTRSVLAQIINLDQTTDYDA